MLSLHLLRESDSPPGILILSSRIRLSFWFLCGRFIKNSNRREWDFKYIKRSGFQFHTISALHVSLDYLVTGEEIGDPVLKSIDSNPLVKEIAHKLTMCDEGNIQIVNAMVDSWVPVENRSKGTA